MRMEQMVQRIAAFVQGLQQMFQAMFQQQEKATSNQNHDVAMVQFMKDMQDRRHS